MGRNAEPARRCGALSGVDRLDFTVDARSTIR